MPYNNDYIPIDGHPELVKDPRSGAILNIDNKALEMYKRNKKEKLINERRINRMENDIHELKFIMNSLLEEIRKR